MTMIEALQMIDTVQPVHAWAMFFAAVASAIASYWMAKQQARNQQRLLDQQMKAAQTPIPVPPSQEIASGWSHMYQKNEPNPMAKDYLNWVTKGGQQAITNVNNMLGLR